MYPEKLCVADDGVQCAWSNSNVVDIDPPNGNGSDLIKELDVRCCSNPNPRHFKPRSATTLGKLSNHQSFHLKHAMHAITRP